MYKTATDGYVNIRARCPRCGKRLKVHLDLGKMVPDGRPVSPQQPCGCGAELVVIPPQVWWENLDFCRTRKEIKSA